MNRGIKFVGEAVKVAGGPPERDGAGEHRPEREEQNRRQCPELVPAFPEARIGAILLGRRRRRREAIVILHLRSRDETPIFQFRALEF